jgi:hypothetical protein
MVIATDDIHRFTVDEYLALVGPGDPRWDHTELIEGFVYDRSPEHVLHARTVWAVGKSIGDSSLSWISTQGASFVPWRDAATWGLVGFVLFSDGLQRKRPSLSSNLGRLAGRAAVQARPSGWCHRRDSLR